MWQTFGVVGVLAAFVLLAYLVTTQPLWPAKASRRAAPADAAALKSWVERLAAFPERSYGFPESMERLARELQAAFGAYGGHTRLQRHEAGGDVYYNVCARYGPVDGPLLVVGAHYDAIEESPGADDNATGVAALIELARLLGERPPSAPVELVAFALEEPPAFPSREMGSATHARELKTQGIPVRAMLALESIGYFSDRPGSQELPLPLLGLFYPSRGDFIAVVGRYRDTALVRRVKSAMRRASDLPVHSFNGPAFVPGISWSDHMSYWDEGLPAVMITDTAPFRNPAYHTAEDRPETLDYARLARVVDGVHGVCREMARP